MGESSVRLSYRDLYPLKWLLGNLLGLVAVWAVMTTETLTMLVGLVVFSLILLACVKPSWLRQMSRRQRITLLAVGLVISAIDFAAFAPDLYGPLARLITVLILFRCTGERRSHADLQLLGLVLIAVVVAGAATLSPLFAVQLVLTVLLGTLFLFFVNLGRGWEQEDIHEADIWKRYCGRTFLRRMYQVFGVRLLILTTGLVGCLGILTAIVFVSVPRWDAAFSPTLGRQSGTSLSGFSEEVKFGEVTSITQDSGIVLRVDPPGDDPPRHFPYFRMAVLDEYTGSGFVMSQSARHEPQVVPGQLLQTDFVNLQFEPEKDWGFYLEGNTSRFLPHLGRFAEAHFAEATEASYNAALRLAVLPVAQRTMLSFRLRDSRAGTTLPPSLRDLPLRKGNDLQTRAPGERVPYPETLRSLVLAPEETAWLKAVAQLLLNQSDGTVEGFARATVSFLREEHAYSLTSSLPNGEGDPLVRWMRSTEPGHCELFAGSMIFLSRAAGLPARMVTGFAGGDWNDHGNYWMVRHQHAHAWVEIYDAANTVWRRVDPTPGYVLPGGVEPVVLAKSDSAWADYLDHYRMTWYRRVLRFDADDQRSLLQSLQEGVVSLFTVAGTIVRDLFTGSLWRLLVVLLALTSVAAGLGSALRWYRRRQEEQFYRSPEKIRRRAGELLQRVRRVAREARQGKAEEISPEFLDTASRLDARLLSFRYGRNDQPRDDLETVFSEARSWLRQRPR